jgi:hypothetical protein
MMHMLNRLIILTAVTCSIILMGACKKEKDPVGENISIKFLNLGSGTEIPTDTVTISSDLSFNCKALVAPTENVKYIYFRIWMDYTKAVEYQYTPTRGKDLGYEIDPIIYDFDYEQLAGIINVVTFQVEAEDLDGAKIESHISFKIQPVNYPFLFRFYDFRSSDTALTGEKVTIRPFFTPTTVNQGIKTMKVFRKTGNNAEELINTYNANDFFYYQTGYLLEYDYQVPALEVGTKVIHRFELESSDGLRHVIQHKTLIE